VFAEESINKPLLSPKLVIKINSAALADEKAKAILLKAHQLAAKSGIPYFANMTKKENENEAFSSSGVKFAADLTGDWETDTLRTGCLGMYQLICQELLSNVKKTKTSFSI
jgi:anaerobic ribonucleoside-triphosphate reductase